MAQQSWVNLLNAGSPWQTAQGATLSTAATATISPQAPTNQDFVLPGQPNGLQWYTGMQLRLRARGVLTTGGTTTSLTLFPAIGVSGTLATTLCTTPAVVLGATTLTALAWYMDADITCTALGSTGNTLISDGILSMSDTTANGGALVTANTCTVALPFATTAFNTYTAATAIGLRATLSAAFGSIICNRFTVEQVS